MVLPYAAKICSRLGRSSSSHADSTWLWPGGIVWSEEAEAVYIKDFHGPKQNVGNNANTEIGFQRAQTEERAKATAS